MRRMGKFIQIHSTVKPPTPLIWNGLCFKVHNVFMPGRNGLNLPEKRTLCGTRKPRNTPNEH